MMYMDKLQEDKGVDPNDLTYYANCLARSIVALNVMGGDHKIQLLKRLSYIYDPKLSPPPVDTFSSNQTPANQSQDIKVQPEEFIILVYQTWLSVPDETVQTERVQLESQPNSSVALSTSLPVNQPDIKATAVVVHLAPSAVESNNTNSFSGLWQSFKNALDYVDSKTSLPPAPIISSEILPPPLSIKQRLLNEFNKAGTFPYQKENEIFKRFEQMYHKAFVKYDNKNPLPNLENREVLICPLTKMRFFSKVIEGFKTVYLNILSAETFETGRNEEPTGTNRTLSDNRKVALMRILQRAINRLRLGESHQQGRKDLIEKMKDFIERINEEFREEYKARTQKKFAELITVINGYHITHGIPIQVMIAAINEMQQIAADLLNDQVSSFNVQAVQTLYNDKNNIDLKKDLEYEMLNQALDIGKLHSEYDFAGTKRFNLMDAVNSTNEKFVKVQNEILSRITSKIETLKQTICADLAEIDKLKPQLSEQDNQMQKNQEETQKLNNEKDSLNTQIKAANDLVDNKNSMINMRNITLQKNVMHNYNKKYRYTSFTQDILHNDNKDKRAPEDKLADRWWDNVWFLGIERFLNWCTGTTKQERKEDAVAAVKLYNATERKVKVDEQTLQIKQEKIVWLFEDASKAELEYKDGVAHQTEYNLMVCEWEDAKRNTESDEAKKRITRLPEIQQRVEQIEKSNRELEPNKSQTAKRLDECKQHVYKNKLELTSIKTRLQSGVNTIVQKILLLSDDSYRAASEMLSSLESKMENIVTDIEKPLPTSTENKTVLPSTITSSTTDNVSLNLFKPS